MALNDNPEVTDAGLARVQDCPRLTRLLIYGTRISDAGLAHLQNCPKIRRVRRDAHFRSSDAESTCVAAHPSQLTSGDYVTQVRDDAHRGHPASRRRPGTEGIHLRVIAPKTPHLTRRPRRNAAIHHADGSRGTGYATMSGSTVATVNPCCNAWAIMIRSNGSRCSAGRAARCGIAPSSTVRLAIP